MNMISTIMSMAALMVSTAAASEELTSCPAEDRNCYEQQHSARCAAASATLDGCKRWMRLLEQQVDEGAKYAPSMLGQAYLALANLTREPIEQRAYRDSAIKVLRSATKSRPDDSDAFFSLAAATEKPEEKIRALRDGLKIAPRDVYALQFLASELSQTGRREDLREAAKLTESAYAAQTGRNKGAIASNALLLYREAGESEQAQRFQQRVRADLGIEGWEAAIVNDEPRRVSELLLGLCDHYALPVVGSNACVQAIRQVTDRALRAGQSASSRDFANAVANATVEAGEAESLLKEERPDWQWDFRRWLESLVQAGLETGDVQYALARVTTGAMRSNALERATKLEPENGQFAFKLGLEYFNRGMWEEARRELQRAERLLSAPQRDAIDYYLQIVEKNVSVPSKEHRH